MPHVFGLITFVAKQDFERGCWVCWRAIFLHSMEANAYAISWSREEFVEDTVYCISFIAVPGHRRPSCIKPSSCLVSTLLFSYVGVHDKGWSASYTMYIIYIWYIYIHTSIHTSMHTYIDAYIHTYLPTYIHTYIFKGCRPCRRPR